MIKKGTEEDLKGIDERLNKLLSGNLPSKPNKIEKKDGEKKDDEKKEPEKINIADVLGRDNMTETTQGYKMECPDCGLQGGRTEGLIVTPEKNIAYCHSSGKWFRMLEAYALKKKIIKCLDGRETGDTSSKILGGELFTLTLDEFKNEFGTDKYNQLIEELNIRKSIELPGNNRLMSSFSDELGDIYKSRIMVLNSTHL